MILVEAVAPFDMQPTRHSTQLYPVEHVVELLGRRVAASRRCTIFITPRAGLYWYPPYQISTARNEGADHDDSKRISEVNGKSFLSLVVF